MRINLEQLRTFLVVVRTGGVMRAAQHLNLTQPAVSARLKALEESLGASVLDRSKSPTQLTQRGELLFQHALKMETLADDIERDVVAPEGVDGRLRIGASETVAQSWLPTFIAELYGRYPNLDIEINVDVSVNLRNALLARQVDLAFLLGPVSEHSVDNVQLPPFELAWYAASSERADVALDAQLCNKPVITYAKDTRPYREMRTEVQRRYAHEVKLFPSASLWAAVRMVSSGLGVAALPVEMAQPLVGRGELRRFDPGWVPSALSFTASFVADPPSHLTRTAAEIAAAIAHK